MAIFLEVNEIYRLMQKELPEGVYPDGAPSAFYSTASIYAKSQLFSEAYENIETVYNNYFPQTADEKQADWEIKVFGTTLDGSLNLAARRQRVIAKIRARPGITKQDMINVVKGVIGEDKDVAIGEWNCDGGSWLIGVSELGVDTILSGANLSSITSFLYPGIDLCDINPADYGLTDEQWQEMRTSAYTYSVLIYSYTMTDAEREEVDELLSIAEPARSAHVIYDGLDPADHI